MASVHLILQSISSVLNGWTYFEKLFITLFCVALVWFVQFHWKRRNLYKHARKIPGPVSYPIIGSALSFIGNPFDIFSTILKLYIEYPKICKVWFGPKCYYGVSDPKYMEVLLANCLEKKEIYDDLKLLLGEGILTTRHKTWKKHRKLITPTFNQRILDRFVPIFNEKSMTLIDQLKHYAGRNEFVPTHLILNFGLDTICETAMGVTVNAQTSHSSFLQNCDRALEIIFLKMTILWYHIDPIFSLTQMSKELIMCLRTIHNFTGKVVKDKIREFENKKQLGIEDEFSNDEFRRKAFLDYLIEISNKENSIYSEKDFQDEVVTFIIAGSDTVAITIGFVFTMLGLHQDVQEKVYNEVLDVIGPHREVECDDLPRLIFLDRVIKETLRLYPAGPLIVRDVHKDIDIGDDIIVPAGVSVLFGIVVLHRNELYWKDPLKFDPDRFLPEEVAKRHPCSYIPFSHGPRNCVGMRYAVMVMKTVVSNVIRKYKISTTYTKVEDIKVQCNVLPKPMDGFKLTVKLR